LAEARDGLEEEANRLSSQVTQLTEMIDEAKTDVVAEATRAGAAEDLLADARASQENLARERDDSRDEVQTVTRRLQGRLDELSAELEPLQEEARSAEARALERERNLERMQSTVQERDEELARLSEHIAALEAHLEDGQSALAARETELGEQQEALRALREEAERSGAESLEAAASERVAAEARVTQAEQRATQAEQTAASLGDELGAARTALSNLENAHDAVRMRVADLQTEVEHKVNRVHELEEQLATKAGSEAEVNRVTAELEQIRTEFESAKAEAVAAASSAEVAHAEREAAVERIAELEGNIEERQRDGAQQEAARDLDLDEVRAQLVDAQGELARVNADLATARSDTADLERELEALRTVEPPPLSDTAATLVLERDEARNEAEQRRNRLAGVESSIGEDQPPHTASDGEGRGEIADLELRLEQAEMRARRAYSASEAAEAALAYEKERRMSLAPTVEAETEANELRNRVAELLDRVNVAVDARRKAEADLAAFRAGVEPREADEEIETSTAGHRTSDEDATSSSLRARLAGAASSRKGSSGDADGWR
jgi:chromosome segregation ATPase